tara:strand:+ start:2523 stop:2843 length:321 start_codon:yes stop_codon:yes gene_type:complete
MKEKAEVSKEKNINQNPDNYKKGPFDFLIGSITSFLLGFAMYIFSNKIMVYFITHKPSNKSELVQNISSSFNTLIIGLSFLATFSFAFIGLGLFIVFIRTFLIKKK